MPVVRAQRQVRPDALPGVRLTAAETPTSLGAGLEAAKAGTDQAIGAIGDNLARMGEGAFAQMHAEAAKNANDQLKIDATAKMDSVELAIHDPQTGLYTRTGQSALTIPADLDKTWNDATSAIAQGASGNKDFQTWLAGQKVQRAFLLHQTAARYIDGELKNYDTGLVNATLANKSNLAILNAQDPDTSQYHMAVGVATLKNAGQRNGESPEMTDAKVLEFRSKTHESIINALLASGQDRAAQIHFEEAKDAGQIDGTRLDDITKRLDAGTTAGDAARIVATVFPTPTDDHAPIDMAALYDKANAMAGDNQKVAEQARQGLREKKSAVDDARRERDGARNEAVWGAVLQGKSIDEIRQLPEYVGNPDIQLKVRDYLQRESEHEDARANAAEARAAGRESRAYTAEVRRENELKMNGFAKFYDLDTPESLRALTPGAIQAMLPDLGHELVGKLLGDRQQLVTGDARNATTQAAAEKKWLSSRIDANVFNEVANDAGLTYVYAKTKSATQKANTGQLLDAVNAEVGRQTAKNGGPLTVDQQRAAAQSVIDQKVLTPGYWFGENTQIAALVNKNDATKAYVPVAQIPAAHVTQAVDTLRPFLSASERGLSAADILAKHRQAIERAYAAHLMGLGADEELRRLKGGQ